ncbi:GNAT family N-acetyltransferase [Arhodomonas sp. AD133]|uniref:GNAT family N-acetyltransferase n=1 Tax=Arhodomonas sp. AD133 TaxID=3415009 RepID=UPI003EC0DB03
MVSTHYASVHAIASDYYPADILRVWSPVPDETRQEWLASLIVNDSTLCGVAVATTGRVVGFCIALPAQSQLKALYVHPEFSNHGIGSGLLRNMEACCLANDVDELELNASYNAESFYRKNGYEKVRETTQKLADGSEMGAILMIKCLMRSPDNTSKRTH